MKELMTELTRIQRELKAPKSQRNEFARFNYRSCEDILEAVKPLLGDCLLTISDEVVEVGDRIYIAACAKIRLGENAVQVNGFAREPEEKKGMDSSQITGAASSYARKYALNGLFLIDDSKDSDVPAPAKRKVEAEPQPPIGEDQTTEIDRLVEVLGTIDEDLGKGCVWASGGKATRVDQLDRAQAAKLVEFLKKKEAAL